jgi:hypothetical protein
MEYLLFLKNAEEQNLFEKFKDICRIAKVPMRMVFISAIQESVEGDGKRLHDLRQKLVRADEKRQTKRIERDLEKFRNKKPIGRPRKEGSA